MYIGIVSTSKTLVWFHHIVNSVIKNTCMALLIYYIKTKSRLSVCLSVGTFWHALSFAVSPRIRAKFARNEAPIIGEHGVSF